MPACGSEARQGPSQPVCCVGFPPAECRRGRFTPCPLCRGGLHTPPLCVLCAAFLMGRGDQCWTPWSPDSCHTWGTKPQLLGVLLYPVAKPCGHCRGWLWLGGGGHWTFAATVSMTGVFAVRPTPGTAIPEGYTAPSQPESPLPEPEATQGRGGAEAADTVLLVKREPVKRSGRGSGGGLSLISPGGVSLARTSGCREPAARIRTRVL